MPKRANIHVDVPLTNLAVVYRNPQFVSDIVLPIVPVQFESDKYYVFGREELKETDSIRAIGAPSVEIDWDVSTSTYQCEEYALKKLLADRTIRNADSAVRPRSTTVNKIMKKLMLNKEVRTMNLVTSGLTSASPSVKWDGTSPDIEGDIDTAKQSILDNAGTDGNYILMNDLVKDVVKKDSTIRNLIRYTIAGSGGQELLVNGELPPKIFNLNVIIGAARYDTAKTGQTASISNVWPDDVIVFYSEPAPSLESLSMGYSFRTVGGIAIKTWRDDERGGEMLEGSVIEDEKITASGAGYNIDNVLT